MSNSSFVNKELQKLTAEIVNKKQLKMQLSKNYDECDKKECRACSCDDDLTHIHFDDEKDRAYMCGTCIKLVKVSSVKDIIENTKGGCPVCYELDGVLYIPGVCNNMCYRCYENVKRV